MNKKATTSTTTNQTQILHKGKEKQLKKKGKLILGVSCFQRKTIEKKR